MWPFANGGTVGADRLKDAAQRIQFADQPVNSAS
jgi:hypothetical protein